MDYTPHTNAQIEEMLGALGVSSLDALWRSVPAELRTGDLAVPEGLVESEILALGESLARRNVPLTDRAAFLGAGCYAHAIPTVVDAVASRGEWLTPYTPYQAEASQGSLQAIYEFQTMICQLLEMDVANASLYDGASSLAEAALLALRATGRPRILISEAVHPHARQVLGTYLHGTPTVLQTVPLINGVTDIEALSKAGDADVACVILQQPNVFGCLEPMAQASDAAHRHGALFIASVYPISLGVLQPPGAYGADLAVGEGRCLGSPPAYGGPGLGLLAASETLLRRLPGRLAGCTVDRAGQRGYTLTLQTREQHIRRERATSNICTNEGWLALRATIYLATLGREGMRELAAVNARRAHDVARRLREIPWCSLAFDQPFFNEFTLRYAGDRRPETVNRALERAGIIGGLPLGEWFPSMSQHSLWCATELTSPEHVDRLVNALREAS